MTSRMNLHYGFDKYHYRNHETPAYGLIINSDDDPGSFRASSNYYMIKWTMVNSSINCHFSGIDRTYYDGDYAQVHCHR